MSADADRWRRVITDAERTGWCAACGAERMLRQLSPGVFVARLVHDASCPAAAWAETWRRPAVATYRRPPAGATDRTAG
jgi:hypothetical protein